MVHGTCGNVPNFPTVVRHSWPFQRRSTVFINKKTPSKLVAKIFANKSGFVPNYTFLNLGLCAACWTRSMCHHELWPISVSHPYSFLSSSLGLAGAKHYPKITIPILTLFFLNFAVPGWFAYILRFPFYFCLLYSGWVVIVVCGSISVQG